MRNILDNLLLASENEIVEFKEARTQFDKDKMGQYFSALSNEANLKGKKQAWLILGVKDDRTVVGTYINDKQINEYKREMSNQTGPHSTFTEVHKVDYSGKHVLMFEIPAGPQGNPVSWKKIWYGRDGESLGGLNITELETIRNQNRSFDWSAQIVEAASIVDLSEEALQQARLMFIKKNPKLEEESKSWDDITFLNKAKITIQGKITNSTILLLGKPESEHFISPAVAKISWILKDKEGTEKDYEHFSCPFLLNAERIHTKIRNLKYRYIKSGTLFPEEVDQFEPYIIREALNNCIVHQDYELGGKINLVEREDGVLTFSNLGSFIPLSIERVLEENAPESKYRNPFLASAMVNLNMIDTIGSGIRKIFQIQKNKFFPLPDYDISNNRVQVQIYGKILDLNYARKIAQIPSLTLSEIFLLDKVSKRKPLSTLEASVLKAKKLIEGRKPNFFISSDVAKVSGKKEEYIKQRGIEDEYCKKMILDYLHEFQSAKRDVFEKILLLKLSDLLSEEQKKNKLKNILQKMKNEKLIRLTVKREWVLDEI